MHIECHLLAGIAAYHKKSFSVNKKLDEYACEKGDLDVAERCYNRAIADAKAF